jgi:hypothetical protein
MAGAVAIWRPLAEKGDADAAFNLGQAYRLGRGVPLDLAQAQSWFDRAAPRAMWMRRRRSVSCCSRTAITSPRCGG